MRRARRKDEEQRLSRQPTPLERVDLRERVLIRNAPPSELRPAVIQQLASIDLIEAIERALGPGLPHARHQRDGSVSLPREVGDHRLAARSHQRRVGKLVSHLDAGDEAQMREPRRPAEGR